MKTLQIQFVNTGLISDDLRQQIEQIEELAFNADDDNNDPGDPDPIDWSSHIEWMGLGWLESDLVTILGLLQRQILVGGAPVWVVGVGGVASHPGWQNRGLSTSLLQAAGNFMRERLDAPFGLLVCGEERRQFYGRTGWQVAAYGLFFTQAGGRRWMEAVVMILPLKEQAWPPGEIDVCGLPGKCHEVISQKGWVHIAEQAKCFMGLNDKENAHDKNHLHWPGEALVLRANWCAISSPFLCCRMPPWR